MAGHGRAQQEHSSTWDCSAAALRGTEPIRWGIATTAEPRHGGPRDGSALARLAWARPRGGNGPRSADWLGEGTAGRCTAGASRSIAMVASPRLSKAMPRRRKELLSYGSARHRRAKRRLCNVLRGGGSAQPRLPGLATALQSMAKADHITELRRPSASTITSARLGHCDEQKRIARARKSEARHCGGYAQICYVSDGRASRCIGVAFRRRGKAVTRLATIRSARATRCSKQRRQR